MASADVKLGGAWAAFEQQQVDREAVIDSLCTQLAELTSMHQQLCQDYDQLQKAYNVSVSKSQQMAAALDIANTQNVQLLGKVETGKFLMEELSVTKQESITQLENCMQQMQLDASSSKQAHQQQVQTLEKQNKELREIIAASMHTKRASTIKLETAMNALNLSKGNAARFIEELEAVKGKVEQLTAERDKVTAENAIVRQQRDCHSDHAQLLTRDNKRFITQLQALRSEDSTREFNLALKEPKAASQTSLSNSNSHDTPCNSQVASGLRQGKQAKAANKAAEQSFKGEDIKNILHKKPFNLSRTILKTSNPNSQSVLEQVQQLRSNKAMRD